MADVITITALNRYVKSLLDSDQVLGGIALRGEVANFVHHYKSGHYYFTLRDERASVKAVMFRQDAQRLAFTPQDGMRVIVRCRVSLYEATGSFGRRKDGTPRKDRRTVRLTTEAEFWKFMALKKEGSMIKIPRRRFLGVSPEVEKAVREIIEENITEYFNVEFDIRRK